MASLEKLMKAFEGLKVFQPGTMTEEMMKKREQPVSRKDKIINCNMIADCICSPNLRNVQDFAKFLGLSIETFLMMCDDAESDVRMVADECLNRTIKTLLDNNLGRLQVELYKEIKKNGSSRCLRAALWRFADMCHLIRPQKCRPYVVNILPCLARICRRHEDAIQETLQTAMHKICPVLMSFSTDSEIKVLLKSFLPNLKSGSAVMRRTAASSLTLICQYTRKPMLFFSWLLNNLLETVIPIHEERIVFNLLGVLLCLRHLIPHLSQQSSDDIGQSLKGSFGRVEKEKETQIGEEQFLQIYELGLHYTSHADHNVITASLEMLQQLLRTPPPIFAKILVTKGAISHTSIYKGDDIKLRSRINSSAGLPSLLDDMGLDDDDGSEVSSSTTGSMSSGTQPIMVEEDTGDLESSDLPDETPEQPKPPDPEADSNGDIDFTVPPSGGGMPEIMTDSNYSNLDIGEIQEPQSGMSQSSSADTLSEAKATPKQSPNKPPPLRKGVSLDVLNGNIETEGAMETEPGKASGDTETICPGPIGSVTDDEIPIVYCTRLLCSKFLLTGYPQNLIPDRMVRVSVKSLALGCIASSILIYPQIYFYNLHIDETGGSQKLSDILLYINHQDPQLKGVTSILIANFIKTSMTQARGRFDQWLKNTIRYTEEESLMDYLVGRLLSVLEDESSVATRLSLVALQSCLNHLLNSTHSEVGLQILLKLLHMKDNPYWLVKVELLEIFGQLDFKLIHYLESISKKLIRGDHGYVGLLNLQCHIIDDVILYLLGDSDVRVRNVASEILVRIIPKLFYPTDSVQHNPIIASAREFTDAYLNPIMHEWSEPPQPLVHGLVKPFHFNPSIPSSLSIEGSLSRVVSSLVEVMSNSLSKYLTYGCCHTLWLLSEEYYVTCYPHSWCCAPWVAVTSKDPLKQSKPGNKGGSLASSNVAALSSILSAGTLEEMKMGSSGGPLPILLACLTSSYVALDLSAHQDTLKLSGNLFSGAAYKCLRSMEEVASINPNTEESHWAPLGDRLLVPMADTLLSHLGRLLNICTHIIEDVTVTPPATRTSLPSLPTAPSLSPIKRNKAKGKMTDPSQTTQTSEKQAAKDSQKDKESEKDKEKNKKEGLGSFYAIPHYMKLYEVMKNAFSNYKISLDLSTQEKFSTLLKTTLEVLAQVLEIASLNEIGKYAEELLGYLKSTFTLEATSTVLCVQQLLKGLFGTNLASQWESTQTTNTAKKSSRKQPRLGANVKPGLYHACFTTPYTQFAQSITTATFKSTTNIEPEEPVSLLGWLKKRAEKKVPAILKPGSKADKASIASYIRLFEPLVIKALKQYTITSSLDLQQQVLNLLAQLVQLRVNYCLLDSDQIFIGFVIKQFEYIEEGQIKRSETLIPHIFRFLVLLSYERYHSKTIIGMPKIIQLCDGIMASGQNPVTHAIPALQPIVYVLFVLRSSNKADAVKDLDTQREVVVAMLLRLIQHYQVLEMLIVVLHQNHKESEEKWKRLSRQVVDMILPLLSKQRMHLDDQIALDVLHRVFEAVAPSVFRPVDIVLKNLFAAPWDLSSVSNTQRWLNIPLSILRVLISQSKEEVVLSRLSELKLGIKLFTNTLERHKNGFVKDMGEPSIENRALLAPEETLARFLLQVIGLVASGINDSSLCSHHPEPTSFLCQQLAHLLLYTTHMFQSGLFRRVTTTTMSLIRQDMQPNGFYGIKHINEIFRELGHREPMLTLQWCNILILLNYDDQPFWSKVLQTPEKYVMGSPSHNIKSSPSEEKCSLSQSCNLQVVKHGGIILFCDYVCENLSDAEHMTWGIINHVNEIIELSYEPPVQDFISAIHRNPAASGLFIQAIHSRCENMTRPMMVKKTLHCLEAIHLSQSGTLLTLLIDQFLHTHHLAVARICDTIACRRVEMLLAESIQESSNQLPLEDLEKLLQFMKTHGLTRRHSRLASLLNKLRNLMCPESRQTLSPEKTHPLALSTADVSTLALDKEMYLSICKDQCFSPNPRPRECAMLLQHVQYSDLLAIIMTKEFRLSILEDCVSLGVHRSLHNSTNPQRTTSRQQTPDKSMDPLLQASQLTLFRHLNNIINMLPVPHKVLCYSKKAPSNSKVEQYQEKMEDFFNDSGWLDSLFHLAGALLKYMISLPLLPWQPSLPPESHNDVARFSVLCLEVLHWMYLHDILPSSHQLYVAIHCTTLVLQTPTLSDLIGQKDHMTWVCSAVASIHQILTSLLMLPNERLVTLPHQDGPQETPVHSFDDYHHVIVACDQISELVHCLKTHLGDSSTHALPHFVTSILRNIIIGLARLPLVNSYARTPPIVWKMGWMPSPSGDMRTKLPPLPTDFIQEKDVLQEFVFRVNTIGWTSRPQFEETWMSLLGVLTPLPLAEGQQISIEEDIDRTQAVVLAIRGITALLAQTTLTPQPGNPSNSIYKHITRDKPLAFLHTRVGKKLVFIHNIIDQELYQQQTFHSPVLASVDKALCNIEHESSLQFSYGQTSIESLWFALGMLNPEPTGANDGEISLQARQQVVDPVSGIDIHSCLQFLLDLYTQWLSPGASPRTALMQINQTVKSIITLSDIFTEKQQYDWMLDTLLEVQRSHPVEDELVNQYLVLGLCKAAAVTSVTVDPQTFEKIYKVLDANFRSAHLPTKVATLQGCLYLLEAGTSDMVRSILPLIVEYLYKSLAIAMHAGVHSQQHTLVMWSTAVFILENYPDEINETELPAKVIQMAVSLASSNEDVVPLPVFLAIIRGLERLLLANSISKQDTEVLVKLSVDRLCLPNSERALAALGLMLTCMYTSKQRDQYTPTLEPVELTYEKGTDSQALVIEDPESLIVAMERVTVLFDRIRKGFPAEAKIVTKMLPTFLADFFPPQDVMNKVIGEFLSSQQSHPQLMAQVVFNVFENLHKKNQESLVQEWVMLSLSNFTQRTPVAMATWSLTCFFISASRNVMLRALLPHVIGRMGKLEIVDRKLFCIAALDFRSQLKDEEEIQVFVKTFQRVAQPETPYSDLVLCCT
ncbi:unnamed protein product [Owenia fusiformis]|uniref:Huntingtin n=1 Tax=Owenia fusiformis TaxID=6347 RepID=A0A8S4NQQ4_OWEFU|nr:unnamed protein product [Owenia fusiformis]